MEFSLEQPQKCSVYDDYVPIIPEGRTTHVYLYDSIDMPNEYVKLLRVLDSAHTGDNVIIHLNTPGGVVDSGIAIRNAIRGTAANVTAKMSGTVASAGTMIALACDHIEITPNLSFMCHEISIDNISGKFSDIKNMQDFYEKQFAQLSHDVYDGFLTEEEITKMHEGKELWFDGGEVLERWKKRNTK